MFTIAVVNETSAADRNPAILAALAGRGFNLINAGMKKSGEQPELTYVHTGFMSALLLNTGRTDFVVGGCGTGEGFLISAMQYPGVYCGLVTKDLDAWLFGQINGGNCISLPLLYEYGWAGDVNLKFLFDKLFSVEFGCGYPEARKESQKKSRQLLQAVNKTTHVSFTEIIRNISGDVFDPVMAYPGFLDILDLKNLPANTVTDAVTARLEKESKK